MTLADFAAKQGESQASAEKRFGATGIVTCGTTHSTAQLTIRADVITTAAHAFYDRRGRLRANPGDCVFTILEGAKVQAIKIRTGSLRVGSVDPYAEPGVKDWAVARLSQPVQGATPYQIAPLSTPGSIFLVANRHEGWVHDGMKAIEACAIRQAARRIANAPRELAIDCSTGQGASGSALMLPGAPGSMIGIYVGWRSSHPQAAGPYAPNHLNYGLAIEGAFRTAIEATVAPEPQIAHTSIAAASLSRLD
ncbi:hypothetical protein GCM10007276_00520 [Agaricicola taiwanensis]|uniref:Serine protease n=1 Tax=Agaricicola taiwanensis TaxID=591372 RepID=A0A8J2VDA9_9RHOB|nr:hypothetical protein GCM10007276_00520 [Agaricicola taiwanensis]